MGVFAEDIKENYNENYNESYNKMMCTGCGEIVSEINTYFIKGESCCIKCIHN